MFTKTLFTASLAAVATAASQDTCRALILSGGGNNGSWETGVLWGLLNYGNPSDYTWDVVTGVSAGSINSSALAGWPVGQEFDAVQWMSDLWKNLHTSDVWKDWTFGKTEGITVKGGAVDNSPLLNFLRTTLSKFSEFGRRVTMATVNVDTGVYTEFTQKNMTFTETADAAVASASIPFVFPPYNWTDKNSIFMDGGTVYNVNIEGAITQCMDLVDDESKIILDILICGAPEHPDVWDEEARTAIYNFLRQHSLQSFYHSTDSTATSMKAHPTV